MPTAAISLFGGSDGSTRESCSVASSARSRASARLVPSRQSADSDYTARRPLVLIIAASRGTRSSMTPARRWAPIARLPGSDIGTWPMSAARDLMVEQDAAQRRSGAANTG